MDCSLPGSSVHGISQARILEWVAIPFSSRSSQSRDRTCILGCFKFAWSGNLVSLLPTNQMHSLGFSDCSQAPLCIVKSYNIVPKLQRSWLIPKEVKYLEKKKNLMVVDTELEPGQRLQNFPQNKPLVTIPNSLAELRIYSKVQSEFAGLRYTWSK